MCISHARYYTPFLLAVQQFNAYTYHMKQLLTKPVLELFTALNGNARIVGGAVRDALMKIPICDIDMATPYAPQDVISLLDKHNIRTIPTGLKHGTVSALINDTLYEMTTLRRDEKTDGRHATVAFTDSYEEDARRRDFTINALYVDKDGRVFDYINGRADIEKKYVRFIGNADERIKEDYLRILRYFRFWGKMGHGQVDGPAIAACTRYAPNLSQISKERKRDELFKILMQQNAPLTLRLMEQTGVLKMLLPTAHITALEKFLQVNPHARVLERLSILSETPCLDLALSNIQKNTLKLYADTPNMTVGEKALKMLLFDRGTDAFQFYVNRAISKEQITPADAQQLSALRMPFFPITGADLLELGYVQGPQIKQALQLAKTIWADLNFTDNKKLVLTTLMAYNKNK